ncbi:Na+/H+ antiporter NhaC family protein [Peribacillus kribbensis]|uniref:Na+/H+ antiporter NhaC family protein n=1 Tax=Peribacillus kribbensis TaxID=356658 RepID=UPI00041BFBB3|nr:Na+/H+ antiporter NhaC family protein [Peribacillus kribbensis]
MEFRGTEVFLVIFITLAGVAASVIGKFPLALGFLPGFAALIFFTLKKNAGAGKILTMCVRGASKTRVVILILLFVSFLLPSWQLSGTISQMVAVTLESITPGHFFVLTFIAAMVFSLLLGTSVGTLSAIGVPIISSALLLHLPAAITAGALISGAFVGDRTSPFSSAHQLLSHTVEISVRDQQRAMFFTTLLAVSGGILFYAGMDMKWGIQHTLSIDHHTGKLSFLPFVPPLVLMAIVLFRAGIVKAFMAGIAAASVIALINGVSFIAIVKGCWFGIEGLGGGLSHMYWLLIFIVFAGAYNGILDEMNVIQPYLDKWLQASKTYFTDSLKVVALSLLISCIAANQTLPIILTGRSFLPHWQNRYGKARLSRLMGDTTMLFPAMVPWSVLAIMCSTVLNVPLRAYLPYAVFLWILPILSIVLSLKGKREVGSVPISRG